MDSFKKLKLLFGVIGGSLVLPVPLLAASFYDDVLRIEQGNPGTRVRVYVSDLASGKEYSFRGGEVSYLASGVKLPIAIVVMREIDQKRITLDTTVELQTTDFVDGAGSTNSKPAGTRLSVRELLHDMLVFSDNTATDLLIKLVGLKKINQWVALHGPGGFSEITMLGDVRRHIYGALHPRAFSLTNENCRFLKSVKDEKTRMVEIARILGVKQNSFKVSSMDEAYSAYYEKGLNSASMKSYGSLLTELAKGRLLSPSSTDFLLRVLASVKTGEQRLKASLPKGVTFAHKTGTQWRRICDFGIVSSSRSPKTVIAACISGTSLVAAEKMLRDIGQVIVRLDSRS